MPNLNWSSKISLVACLRHLYPSFEFCSIIIICFSFTLAMHLRFCKAIWHALIFYLISSCSSLALVEFLAMLLEVMRFLGTNQVKYIIQVEVEIIIDLWAIDLQHRKTWWHNISQQIGVLSTFVPWLPIGWKQTCSN